MGEDEPSENPTPLPVTMERNASAQIGLAFTVLALILASNSIINDDWLNERADTDSWGDITLTQDLKISLTDTTSEACVDGSDCESESEDFKFKFENCGDDCTIFEEFQNTGFVTIILLLIGSVILLVATVFQVRLFAGMPSKTPNLLSLSGSIWLGLTLLIWHLMLPEAGTEMSWGQGPWILALASCFGIIAGFSNNLYSVIEGPPRMRAKGVRSGTEMKEFPLKESSCGNHTLSILVDSDLIRVARISRIGASPQVKDVLATRRDSYTGFSHQRLDWLDDFKGLWWILSGASLISAFMISGLFFVIFGITTTLLVLQLMDPERFVISTNSGNHSFFINRWRSNRELTDLAMDLVDDVMIGVLRGGDLDTETLDKRANLIATRFALNQKAIQDKMHNESQEKQAQKLVPPPPQQLVANAPESTSINPSTENNIEDKQAKAAEPEDSTTDEKDANSTEESESGPEVEEPNSESTNGVAEPDIAVPNSELDKSEGEKIETQNQATPPSNSPTPMAPSTAAPPPMASIPPPPIAAIPSMAPPPPATAIPPPPPSAAPPSMAPPPPIAAIPPPPIAAIPPPSAAPPSMAPPPPIAAIPPPPATMPPPPGAGFPPPMLQNQPVTSPPPVIVKGAPREDNLSDDEKDDLLGDLSD